MRCVDQLIPQPTPAPRGHSNQGLVLQCGDRANFGQKRTPGQDVTGAMDLLLLRSLLIGALLAVAALAAAAEPLPELLKPVDPAVEAKLMAKTNFDFRQQRYAAKRFRIVDINWELLSQEGARFTVTPFEEPGFEDLAITVSTQTTDRDPHKDQLQNWAGEIEGSAWLAQGGSNGQVLSLWINTGPREVSLEVAREIAADTADTARYAMVPKRSNMPDEPSVTSRLNVRTLSGVWIPLPGLQVKLQPIDDDPRYHVVIWVDRDKVRSGSHGGPDNERKLKALIEFREQLKKERSEAGLDQPE